MHKTKTLKPTEFVMPKVVTPLLSPTVNLLVDGVQVPFKHWIDTGVQRTAFTYAVRQAVDKNGIKQYVSEWNTLMKFLPLPLRVTDPALFVSASIESDLYYSHCGVSYVSADAIAYTLNDGDNVAMLKEQPLVLIYNIKMMYKEKAQKYEIERYLYFYANSD